MISNWRRVQLQNFTSWDKLVSFLNLSEKDAEKVLKKSTFPLNLPLRLAQKAQKSTLNDPILKQFLPSFEELKSHPNFVLDPVQDQTFRKENTRLLQKYEGRALLVTTSACAMHCRYCFRKNFDYESQNKEFLLELEIIRKNTSLKEVILSGGDPLSLSDDSLSKLLKELDSISHIKRIRFHTRFPIGIPERIDESFLKLLGSVEKQIIFVIHANHAKELDEDILIALKKIQTLGIPVLSQSVLLKDVNDDVKSLQELFETLSDNGIIPYYLHLLDAVQGSFHFDVLEDKGKALMKELSTRMSGYSLPKLSKEEPGKPSKTLIAFL